MYFRSPVVFQSFYFWLSVLTVFFVQSCAIFCPISFVLSRLFYTHPPFCSIKFSRLCVKFFFSFTPGFEEGGMNTSLIFINMKSPLYSILVFVEKNKPTTTKNIIKWNHALLFQMNKTPPQQKTVPWPFISYKNYYFASQVLTFNR